MREQRRREHPSGTTLAEVLVIIALGAVLTSLVLPGIARARCRMQASQCASNLRRIGYAVSLYVKDTHGTLPYAEGSALPRTYPTAEFPYGSIATSLRSKLKPYIGNERAFRCPNDRGVEFLGVQGCACDLFGSSYLWNDGLAEPDAQGTARLSINGAEYSSIPTPSRTMMCLDYSPEWHQALVRSGMSLMLAGRVNVVYVDGHVAQLVPSAGPFSPIQVTPESATPTTSIR